MPDITVQELKAKLDAKEEFVLIDVRQAFEHETFNLGGKLIPLGELPANLDNLDEYKDAEIVLYCRSGARSGAATEMMKAQGFTKARNLLGGVLNWQSEFVNP